MPLTALKNQDTGMEAHATLVNWDNVPALAGLLPTRRRKASGVFERKVLRRCRLELNSIARPWS